MKKSIIFFLAMFFKISAYAQPQTNVTTTIKMPSPAGHAGQYLTNNGSAFSWAAATATNAIIGGGTLNYLPIFSAAHTLTNSAISQSSTGINSSIGNITLGTYVGVPSISTIHMNATPTSTNYVLAETNARSTYLNGNDLNLSVNGSVKASVTSTSFQSLNPFTIGATLATGSTALRVNGETYFDGNTAFYQGHDGIGTGTPNFNIINPFGGTYFDYNVLNGGYSWNYKYNGTRYTRVTENQGYYSNFVNARYDVANYADNKIKLSVNMSNGYTAIGDDYFVPITNLDVRGSSYFSGRMCINTPNNLGLIGNASFAIVNSQPYAISVYSGTYVPLMSLSSSGIFHLDACPLYSGSLTSGDVFKYVDAGSPSGYSIGIMP